MDKCNDCHEEVKAKEGSKECLMCHTSNDDYTAVYPKDGRNPNPCEPGFWGVNSKLPGVIRQNFDHLRHFDNQKPLLEKALKEQKDAAKRASLRKELKDFPDSECIFCHPQIRNGAISFTQCVFGKWQKSTLTLLYKGFHSYRWEGCKRIQLIIQLT